MIDRDVLLKALSTVCNADVTLQSDVTVQSDLRLRSEGATQQLQLFSKNFIHEVLDADETSQVSRSNFDHLIYAMPHQQPSADSTKKDKSGKKSFFIKPEFFDQRFDYDFTNLTDVKPYTRGGEVYERPCGWQRFAIKVLGDYEDNTWLGTRYRSTESVPGEWPVSYHGTTKEGAEGIVEGNYEPGDRERFGRGIYSTPYLSVANGYAIKFTSKKDGKTYKVMLQNRVNPAYRVICNNKKYWLICISKGTSKKEEKEIVQRAIRPYGLLLKEA